MRHIYAYHVCSPIYCGHRAFQHGKATRKGALSTRRAPLTRPLFEAKPLSKFVHETRHRGNEHEPLQNSKTLKRNTY